MDKINKNQLGHCQIHENILNETMFHKPLPSMIYSKLQSTNDNFMEANNLIIIKTSFKVDMKYGKINLYG